MTSKLHLIRKDIGITSVYGPYKFFGSKKYRPFLGFINTNFEGHYLTPESATGFEVVPADENVPGSHIVFRSQAEAIEYYKSLEA